MGSGGTMSHADPVLEIRNVAKQYGQITALTGVNIQMFAGEIVALLGDNGAGKSTLMNI
ncbi:MAG: ATP-binding cassette domain-containing protein, partial [Afipia sp.]|nr:ATP-binding cassette domain-containing protein [Afipia sp.]